jgi:hypothetical protein
MMSDTKKSAIHVAHDCFAMWPKKNLKEIYLSGQKNRTGNSSHPKSAPPSAAVRKGTSHGFPDGLESSFFAFNADKVQLRLTEDLGASELGC